MAAAEQVHRRSSRTCGSSSTLGGDRALGSAAAVLAAAVHPARRRRHRAAHRLRERRPSRAGAIGGAPVGVRAAARARRGPRAADAPGAGRRARARRARCGGRRRARVLGRAGARRLRVRRPERGRARSVAGSSRAGVHGRRLDRGGIAVRERAGAPRLARGSIAADGRRDLGRTRHGGAGRGPGRPLVVVAGGAVGGAARRGRLVRAQPAESASRTSAASISSAWSSCASSRAAAASGTPGDRGDARSDCIATCSPASRPCRACSRPAWRARRRLGRARLDSPSSAGCRRSMPMLDGTIVYPRYFATMGIPIVKGRDFNDDDLRPDAAPVVLVNEAFVREVPQRARAARRRSRRHDASGRAAADRAARAPLNIIGVVKDSRFPALRDARAADGVPDVPSGKHRLRPNGPARPRVARAAPTIMRPVTRRGAGDRQGRADGHGAHARRRSGRRARARAAGGDALGHLRSGRARADLHRALRPDGLHGRAPDGGNRHPHGARREPIRRALAGRRGRRSTIVLAGLAIGVPVAWVTGRLASRVSCHRCSTRSPRPIQSRSRWRSACSCLVAMTAALLPARRAARIDPMAALRVE